MFDYEAVCSGLCVCVSWSGWTSVHVDGRGLCHCSCLGCCLGLGMIGGLVVSDGGTGVLFVLGVRVHRFGVVIWCRWGVPWVIDF